MLADFFVLQGENLLFCFIQSLQFLLATNYCLMDNFRLLHDDGIIPTDCILEGKESSECQEGNLSKIHCKRILNTINKEERSTHYDNTLTCIVC